VLILATACGGNGTPSSPSAPAAPTRIIGLSGDVAFGDVILGRTVTATLTIANRGNAPLTVTGLTVPSRGYTASWTSGTVLPSGLQPVVIQFTPTALENYNGVLAVNGDQTSGVNTVNLSGRGTAATRIIGLSGDLAFGEVTIGQTAWATLTITNSGNAPLTVTGVIVPSPYAGSWTSGTILPFATQEVVIQFTPRAAGSYNGVLTVNGDQTSGVNAMSVSGRGTRTGVAFSVSATCSTVKAGTYAPLACVASVTTPGNYLGLKVVADLRAFGLSEAWGLPACGPCGFPYPYDLDLHVPADMPAGKVPIAFTASDDQGRTATTTANLQIVR
jgi:hypothetical protein